MTHLTPSFICTPCHCHIYYLPPPSPTHLLILPLPLPLILSTPPLPLFFAVVVVADASHNIMTSFPNQVYQCPIKTLNLSHNEIIRMPGCSVTDPKQLRLQYCINLDVSHNKIESLEREFGLLKRLKIIHAEHNQLTVLEESISSLRDLQILDYSNNQVITFFPHPHISLHLHIFLHLTLTQPNHGSSENCNPILL